MCSGAPDCAALNRHPCHDVANTCGVCFQRHLGEEGNSNQSCFGRFISLHTHHKLILLHFYSIDPCIDGILNYEETDVDCGGPLCPTCDVGNVRLIDNLLQTHPLSFFL